MGIGYSKVEVDQRQILSIAEEAARVGQEWIRIRELKRAERESNLCGVLSTRGV